MSDMSEKEVARFIRAQTLKLRLSHLERVLQGEADDIGECETKSLATLEWKQIDLASGLVTGYASTWEVDLGNDAIEKGAYQKTLSDARTFARAHNSPTLFPVLWQHQREEPIGYVAEAREDSTGLRCTFLIDPTIERGRQALAGLKTGTLSFSIGYKALRHTWRGSIRVLQEIKLVEVSVVTLPMQPEARAIPGGDPDGRAA